MSCLLRWLLRCSQIHSMLQMRLLCLTTVIPILTPGSPAHDRGSRPNAEGSTLDRSRRRRTLPFSTARSRPPRLHACTPVHRGKAITNEWGVTYTAAKHRCFDRFNPHCCRLWTSKQASLGRPLRRGSQGIPYGVVDHFSVQGEQHANSQTPQWSYGVHGDVCHRFGAFPATPLPHAAGFVPSWRKQVQVQAAATPIGLLQGALHTPP